MPVSLATIDMEVRRTAVQGQPKQKVHETLSPPIKSWEQW
jgi:hypothetical protein